MSHSRGTTVSDFILIKSDEKSCKGCCFDVNKECDAYHYISFQNEGCTKEDHSYIWESVEEIKEEG